MRSIRAKTYGRWDVLGRMTMILIADDNPDIRSACMMALSSRAYSVVVASDGQEALELLRHHPIELLVTDLVMPDGGGTELIANVQREFPDLPVIAMSGNLGAQQNLRHAANLGAVVTLQKPFNIGTLLAAVERSLATRQVTADLA